MSVDRCGVDRALGKTGPKNDSARAREKTPVNGRAGAQADRQTYAMRAKRSLIDDGVDPVAGPDGVTSNRRRRPSGFAFWAVRPSANGNADRTHRF